MLSEFIDGINTLTVEEQLKMEIDNILTNYYNKIISKDECYQLILDTFNYEEIKELGGYITLCYKHDVLLSLDNEKAMLTISTL